MDNKYTQVGTIGKVEIQFWHIGDDVRVSLCGSSNNSIYWVADYKAMTELRDALQQRRGYGATENRFTGELMWDDTGVIFKSGDVLYADREYTSLNNEQLAELVAFLTARLDQGFIAIPDELPQPPVYSTPPPHIDEEQRKAKATTYWQEQWSKKRS